MLLCNLNENIMLFKKKKEWEYYINDFNFIVDIIYSLFYFGKKKLNKNKVE